MTIHREFNCKTQTLIERDKTPEEESELQEKKDKAAARKIVEAQNDAGREADKLARRANISGGLTGVKAELEALLDRLGE